MERPKLSPQPQMMFWDRLNKELKVVARKLVSTTKLPLWEDVDDLAQDALVVAIKFVDARLMGQTVTADRHEALRVEAYRYARTALKNNFLDRVRSLRGVADRVGNGDLIFLASYCTEGGISEPSPEDHAIADDLLRRICAICAASHSEVYRRIGLALEDFSSSGILPQNPKDLLDLVQVSPNNRRDFSRMLATKLGLSPSQILEERPS